MGLDVSKTKNGAVGFVVKVVPGSSKTSIEGSIGGMLKVKIASVAEKGKANKELTAFLAKLLGIKKNDIRIVSGAFSPVKTLEVDNIDVIKIKTITDI